MTATFPKMQCEQCGRCCGLVGVSRDDYSLIERYAERHEVKPMRQGISCPWLSEAGCLVYPVRPFICRLFGHGTESTLVCPKGHNVNLPAWRVAELSRRFLPRKNTFRWLHEVCFTFEELQRIVEDYFREKIEKPDCTVNFPKSREQRRESVL